MVRPKFDPVTLPAVRCHTCGRQWPVSLMTRQRQRLCKDCQRRYTNEYVKKTLAGKGAMTPREWKARRKVYSSRHKAKRILSKWGVNGSNGTHPSE